VRAFRLPPIEPRTTRPASDIPHMKRLGGTAAFYAAQAPHGAVRHRPASGAERCRRRAPARRTRAAGRPAGSPSPVISFRPLTSMGHLAGPDVLRGDRLPASHVETSSACGEPHSERARHPPFAERRAGNRRRQMPSIEDIVCRSLGRWHYADESAAPRRIATTVATNGPTVRSVSVITVLTNK